MIIETRYWNVRAIVTAVGLILASELNAVVHADDNSPVIDIGSRRELFVDRFLIGSLNGTTLKLHTPQLMPPAMNERPHGHYATMLSNGEKFQFYYRGDKDPKVTWKTHGIEAYHDGEVTLYAESQDAIN